jgi:hypothetical protein
MQCLAYSGALCPSTRPPLHVASSLLIVTTIDPPRRLPNFFAIDVQKETLLPRVQTLAHGIKYKQKKEPR